MNMTKELVKETIEKIYGKIEEIEIKDMDVGVLSQVFDVQVREDAAKTHSLVVKCPRPEFPFLHTMFAVETAFYTQTNHDGIPFRLPKMVFSSADIVVLERVHRVSTFKCIDGCPSDRIVPIMRKLGQMHGNHWGQSFSQLADVPGIGANLSGEAKQSQFPTLYQPFLDELDDASLAKQLEPICKRLCEGNILERIHNAVGTWSHHSLLHGDFHVANMLFGEDSDDIWLLDWATSGASNPLRDVAFFFIVGVNSQDRQPIELQALEEYFKQISSNVSITLDEIIRMYRLCVLNQFLILVVYNQLTMSLTKQGSSVEKQESLRRGFLETNRRACLAVLDNFSHVDTVLTTL